ncbi:DUF3794 domain-containing protein [Oscillospiraceae bacterium OttesenSCG-928-F05]|nr:DUF3794 domain-containing protein [Oscillospiraceae bacterium OttesenSCG-928-F05]
MELELKKNACGFYDSLYDLTAEREETCDVIVPDACPDILRIAETYGRAMIRTKESRDEKLEVGGQVRATVLYVPEDGRGLRKLEVELPFSHFFETQGVKPSDKILASAHLKSVDARTINPRKILVRAAVDIHVQVFEARSVDFCCGAENDDGSVQMLMGEHSALMLQSVQTKEFTITDELELPSVKPAAAELLKYDVALKTGEVRVIGHKVIFKGDAEVRALYKAAGEFPGEDLFTFEMELPFSQIVELDELPEDAECRLVLLPTAVDFGLKDDTGSGARAIAMTIGAEAQVTAYAMRRIETVSDLYSTLYDAAINIKPNSFTALKEHTGRHQTVRETIETGVTVRSVIDMDVQFTPCSYRREGEALSIDTTAIVKVVYYGEDNGIYSATRSIPVSQQVETAEGVSAQASVRASGQVAGASAMDGIEVRFGAEFDVELRRMEQVSTVNAVTLEEPESDADPRPSVVLRAPEEGESLWTVAKHYRTTMAAIMEANALDDTETPIAGRLLLIPGKR